MHCSWAAVPVCMVVKTLLWAQKDLVASMPSVCAYVKECICPKRICSLAGLPLLCCHWHLSETPCVTCKGGSIEAIAEAKAGIMKPNRPVVIATQPYPNALEVLEQHAKQLNCQIIQPSDYIDLKHKETVQEGNNMVQTVTANPRGLSWMQPTGQTDTTACACPHHRCACNLGRRQASTVANCTSAPRFQDLDGYTCALRPHCRFSLCCIGLMNSCTGGPDCRKAEKPMLGRSWAHCRVSSTQD